MPVVFQEYFEQKLREWALQPDLDLEGYELLPLHVPLSIETHYIDGVFWEKSQLRMQLDFVAGRFWQGGSRKNGLYPTTPSERYQEEWRIVTD
ncbi:hypothetical protein TSTA_001710 [Talaromyces stipitatus ATCC 10500]|uniref:Uncharacterized protein n=1 Tax=Talaromyces stipitatus (strain ATCC 10500 / CBS 375.48 / QM 6759 / NRRL 1006) TaxID=441959 RepID=B8MT20_TALSN|nr:uncharacterized protein TSTA_001710 [Talaromyces stipitatus ATCC 10500]EED12100.1 hypothetical protein TSTA_001710 [Talaromyces stipitatus ATCC 10500]